MLKGVSTQKCKGAPRNNAFEIKEHQQYTKDKFINSIYKGMMLYWKLGSGKTCGAITTAIDMLSMGLVEQVIVCSAGSLRTSWITEYCKRCGISSEFLETKFLFLTLNYSIGPAVELMDFNKTLVIIDEAHKFINAVANLSYHQTILYKKLKISDCRILALTGTPLYREVFHWCLLGNLLKPDTFPKVFVESSERVLLPGREVMNDLITKTNWDKEYMNITNEDFQGIISYFPGEKEYYPTVNYHKPIEIYMTGDQESDFLKALSNDKKLRGQQPKQELRLTNIEEYNKRFVWYIRALAWQNTRRVSNIYYPPEYKFNPDTLAKYGINQKYITKDEIKVAALTILTTADSLDPEALDKMTWREYKDALNKALNTRLGKMKKKYARDILEMYILSKDVEQINKLEYDKKLVESDDELEIENNIVREGFEETKENTEEVAADIEEKKVSKIPAWYRNPGWVSKEALEKQKLIKLMSPKIAMVFYNIMRQLDTKHVIFTFFKIKGGVILLRSLLKLCGISSATYSGDIKSDNKRKDLIDVFNSEENTNGEIINVLLLTEAGAEGINLLEVNNFHILESSDNERKTEQAIGRVVRYKSHVNMIPERQYVNIFRYWSMTSKGQSIDKTLYEKGVVRSEDQEPFLLRLQQNSIENI